MEHFVRMGEFAKALRFPPEFENRLRYDSKSGRLIFRGFMSKAEFDRLCRVSEDWAYRRGLEDLFRECAAEDNAESSGLRRMLGSLFRSRTA